MGPLFEGVHGGLPHVAWWVLRKRTSSPSPVRWLPTQQATQPKAIFGRLAPNGRRAFVQILHKLFTTACGRPAAPDVGISAARLHWDRGRVGTMWCICLLVYLFEQIYGIAAWKIVDWIGSPAFNPWASVSSYFASFYLPSFSNLHNTNHVHKFSSQPSLVPESGWKDLTFQLRNTV